MMLQPTHILTALAAVALLFTALHDIAFRTIPNWVPTLIAADAVLLRLLDHRLPSGLACGLAIFTLATACWWRGWLGGGDVKLLGATAILVPPILIPGYVTSVAFAGGLLALLYLSLERILPTLRPHRPASLAWRIMVVECRRIRRRASLPYATAISAAALLTLAIG